MGYYSIVLLTHHPEATCPYPAQVITLLRDAGHQQVNVKTCGRFIDPKYQQLGACLDGVLNCKCCERMLLELYNLSSDQRDYWLIKETIKYFKSRTQ